VYRNSVVHWCGVRAHDAIETIGRLLDDDVRSTVNTSMRLPAALRDAATIAVHELDAAPSTTALTSDALRSSLEAIIMQRALDDHYEEHPEARPDLGDLTIAAAELDGHTLAREPERLRRAAREIVAHRPDADPEDVLLWAQAQISAAA
jgi:hypothetical protein